MKAFALKIDENKIDATKGNNKKKKNGNDDAYKIIKKSRIFDFGFGGIFEFSVSGFGDF
jgi:hypothetical protein